jgi:hypothetical protein
MAGADPVGFLDTVAAELKDLRAENAILQENGIVRNADGD